MYFMIVQRHRLQVHIVQLHNPRRVRDESTANLKSLSDDIINCTAFHPLTIRNRYDNSITFEGNLSCYY